MVHENPAPSPRFLLVYDPTLLETSVTSVSNALQKFDQGLQVIDIVNYYFGNFLPPTPPGKYECLMILAHCEKIENNYSVGGFLFAPENFLNVSNRVWISGCASANMQTNYLIQYDPNDFASNNTKIIQSLILDPATSSISVQWIVNFLELMWTKKNDFSWWCCDGYLHPLMSLAQLENTSLESYQHALEKVGSEGDEILYPSKTSFVEVFHYGVFVALYLSCPDLKLLTGDQAKESWSLLNRKGKGPKEDVWEPGAYKKIISDGNTWFDFMRVAAGTQEVAGESKLDQQTINSFQANLQGSISSCLNKKYKMDDTRPSCDELRQRLLCHKPISGVSCLEGKKSLAIVFRVCGDHRDFRLDANTEEYEKIVKDLISSPSTAAANMTIVLMDSKTEIDLKDLKDQNREIIDLRGHHDPATRNLLWKQHFDCGDLLESDCQILNQLWFLSACIKRFNLVAAFGVHGGFLDILNVLGVPPTNTFRFFSKTLPDPEIKKKIKNWKSRTKRLCQWFYPQQDENKNCWFDNPTPGHLTQDLHSFFRNLSVEDEIIMTQQESARVGAGR
jgi:hypothetical protein